MKCQRCENKKMTLTHKAILNKKLKVFYICNNCGQKLIITYPTEKEKI